MLPYAQYDLLAMVDSDTAVRPDYLRAVTSPFQEEGVGLVTWSLSERAYFPPLVAPGRDARK
jgi:cellulose synthase/poly-beta-1,6-N-acetylglucosamine synthase-like glycosyltransferase